MKEKKHTHNHFHSGRVRIYVNGKVSLSHTHEHSVPPLWNNYFIERDKREHLAGIDIHRHKHSLEEKYIEEKE